MSAPVQIFPGLDSPGLPAGVCHLAVGMFDGVHRGHQAVVAAARHAALASGALAGVLTFWPHPSRLFRPAEATRMIFDASSRRELLAQQRVNFIIEQSFTREFAAIEAEAFIPHLREALPQLATIFVGENWRFGRGRRGDVAMLVSLARSQGVQVVSLQRLSHQGAPVSSTRIREVIERGEIATAGDLLGFPYFCQGTVVPGRQLGHTIGFPTLNLDWQPDLRPALGVYVVRVRAAAGGPALPAVANYGVRPTVDGAGAPVLEVHVLGDCPFGRGDHVRVDWVQRLRAEQKFASLDALRAQIARDRDAAQTYFEKS